MSEPHQSRVFTFIGNHANQLKNTCARGLRQLKVAVVWGGQILLYPFQLLAQTNIFQPQISTPPSHSVLPQPTSDINIEQALELVEEAGHPILLAPKERLRQQSGSANELAHKAPLAVDDWSFIDESLWNTSHGNIAIKSQEISYSPSKSRQVTSSKPIIRGLSSLLIDRQLVLVTIDNELLDILTIAQQQEIRRRIGIDIATTWHQWHTNKLFGDDSAHQLAGGKQLLIANESSIEREISPQNLFDRLSNWFQKIIRPQSQSSAIKLESIESVPPRSLDRLPPAQNPFTPQPPSFERWLEFPQLPPINENLPITTQDNSVREIIAKLQPNWFKNLWNYYRDYIYIPSANQSEIIHQPTEFELIPIEPKFDRITSIQSPEHQTPIVQNSVKLSAQFYRDLEHHPDWIEAESEPIGYSRSPLARFLAWLDRIVLSIENWLIKIWNNIAHNRSSN
jgi:hypothetical protein